MKAHIVLKGCHEKTDLYMSITPEEFVFLKRIAELSQAVSQYECQPILIVEEERDNEQH